MPDIKAKSRSKPGMTGAKFKSGLAKTGKKHESNQELTGFTADNPEIHQHGPLVADTTVAGQQTSNEALKGGDVSKGSPNLVSNQTPAVTNQINNNNNIKKSVTLSSELQTSNTDEGGVIFDRKRLAIGEEFFKAEKEVKELRIPAIVASADENGTALIYEDVAENTFDQNNQDSKISENETNEILATDHEELLKPLETPGATDSIVTTDAPVLIYNPSGNDANSTIIDATKLSLYGSPVTVADFSQSTQASVNTYMASLLSQNEPEDLTGNRRGSNANEELKSLELSAAKSNQVVVTTSDGPVVLTAGDITNFQTTVPSSDAFSGPADFGPFDSRPSYGGPSDQYRPAEIYCAPGEYPQRMSNSDGQFLPYQYKVEPCSTPVPNANHINSPDSGIGDPTLNASHPPESFENYPHEAILNEIGSRKPWHQDYGRPNEEKIVIPKMPETPYGFKYTLEAPTSSSVRREDDRITYVNKGQFYGITLEYAMDPDGPNIKNHTVKSIIMVVFRDGKTEEEEQKYWHFWHSRQHSVKQRILDADTKNSVGIHGPIEEIAHNALQFCWNPYESPAKINLAVQCLSTDFSTQKGVKGMPLHVQIDTYDDIRDPSCPVFHRAYCQIKVFCDKGAERKARDEERRANKRKMNNTGKRRIDEMYHQATDRSDFYSMADLAKPPVYFRPITDPEKAALDFGTELPSFYTAGSRGSPPDHGSMLKSMNGSNGSPSPSNTPATLDVQPNYTAVKPATLDSHQPNFMLKANHDNSVIFQPLLSGNGSLLEPPLQKRARIFPPTCERIMIYVKQETEDAFTALHVKPPTAQGLIGAIESKYKISGSSIRYLFKQNTKNHKVKIDDDMIAFYSNEAAFLMQVHVSEQQGPHGEDVYDITFTEQN